MPRLALLSTDPVHLSIAVEVSHDDAERLGMETVDRSRPAPVLVVTLNLDWETARLYFGKALRNKGKKVRLGLGMLEIKRTHP